MKLYFMGSGIERASTHLADIEVDAVVHALRERFDSLVFGGSTEGLMFEFARSFRQSGGHVTSVVPRWLEPHGLVYEADETIFCEDLAERKKVMSKDVDAVLCYPGGVGTWDELFDLLACHAVERDTRCPPVYLYSWEKYYAPLLLQIETAAELGLIHAESISGLQVFESVSALKGLITDVA